MQYTHCATPTTVIGLELWAKQQEHRDSRDSFVVSYHSISDNGTQSATLRFGSVVMYTVLEVDRSNDMILAMIRPYRVASYRNDRRIMLKSERRTEMIPVIAIEELHGLVRSTIFEGTLFLMKRTSSLFL